jgi:hypothetical protein
MRRKKITVRAIEFGKMVGRSVEAEVTGPLAVHQSVATLRPWTVTHVASGLLLMTFDEKPAADAFLKGLLKLNLDWDFKRNEACPVATGAAIGQLVGHKARGGVLWRAEATVTAKVS